MRRLHLRIRGRVQGVFFRASAVEQARTLGLAGWIRNRFDGSIELVAEGGGDSLTALRSWCAHGPPGANVREIDEIDSAPTGEFVEFSVQPDG